MQPPSQPPRSSGRPLVDRHPQHIPLPIGDLRVVRRDYRMSPLYRRFRNDLPNYLALLGVALALAGAVLVVASLTPAVYEENGIVHVGSMVLPPAAAGSAVYDYGGGNLPALALDYEGPQTVGAMNETVGGVVETGRCVMTVSGSAVSATCAFTIGKTRFTSEDSYSLQQQAWLRTYSNGETAVIPVPADGTAIPVPFPVGFSPK